MWAPAAVWLWACGCAAGQQVLEVQEVPGPLASRVEGVYTPWHARWINGRVWKRSNVGLNARGEVTPPTFFGPFCGHVHDGPPTEWCFAECDEELMLKTRGLLLPCGASGEDGTPDCPPPPPPPPPPAAAGGGGGGGDNPKPYYCDVLGHARRWHEAGRPLPAQPPSPEWWRWRMATHDWVGAMGPSGGFEVQLRPEVGEPAPGERLALRRDGTARPGAHPGYCLGAEGGSVAEGTPVLFWQCGPHAHELFSFERSAATEIRPQGAPSLCVGASGRGEAARLVPCARAPPETVTRFEAAADGTVRAANDPSLCLGSGPDRPVLGSKLRLEPCTLAAAAGGRAERAPPAFAAAGGCAAQYLPGGGPPPGSGPGAEEEPAPARAERLERELASAQRSHAAGVSRVLAALEALGSSSSQGQQLASRTAQLEDEVAKLRAMVAKDGSRQRRAPAPRAKVCAGAGCD